MNNVLLWIGGVLVAVLCALFAVPHFVDWTRYRGVFEEEASRILGREVRVSGAVNLRLLPAPFVRFEKLRLADAAGQTGEPFFRADDFTLWLAPAPLLRGAIEAREVELRRPVLKLRLNADGGGNWQTLSIARGQLPFIPSDVALQSVLITDGVISIDGADGRELGRVGSIKGELAVSALEGPFRFKGTYDWGGVQHEFKTSTTVFDADGGLKFKAQLAVPSTANSFTLDGRLSDLSSRVKVDGQLTGQLGFVPGQIDPAVAAKNGSTAADPARIPVELRATVAANSTSANLTDLSLSFEQDDKPQLISGSAQIGWRDSLEIKSDWTARWLDLDKMLGRTATSKPLETFRHLTTSLAGLVPSNGRGVATFAVDQMTLGGDAVSDASLRVERENDALRLSHLRAGLPGGARAQISGVFPNATVADTFDGDVDVRGTNLNKLMTWAGLGSAMPEGRNDGAFSLRAKLGFEPKALAFKDATASVGAAMLAGGLSYRWSERPRLDVVLQGDDIDLSLVSPHALDLSALAREIVGLPVPAESAQRFKFDPKSQDVTLRVRAGRLRDADRDLQDVDVDATLIGGRLALRRLHMSSGPTLDLDADGDIAGLGTRALGALRGTIAAADESALTELLELFGVPNDDVSFNRLKAMTPARLGWTAKFGEARANSPGRAEIWVDGTALGRRLVGSVRLDGGVSEWRQHPVQMNVAIDRPDWARLRRLLPSEGPPTAASPNARLAVTSSGARGKFLLSASGQPDQGLSTYLKLEDDAFDASVSGRVTLGAIAIATAEGEMQLRTSDAAQAFVALGLGASGIPAIAVEGAADISFKDQKFKIAPSALDVAGSIIGGEVFVSQRNERSRIEGRLTASVANIPRLLDLLGSSKNTAARNPGETVWPSDAFDFSLLDRVEGRVRLEAAQLDLTPELGLPRAAIAADFGPGRIDLETLEGDVLGGRLTSRWLLEKAASGANLTGNLAVDQVRLDFATATPASGATRPTPGDAASGSASVKATVAGRGSSVRNLVAALTGKGEIDIAGNEAGVPAPGLAKRIADDVLASKLPATLDAVEGYVIASLKAPQRTGLGTRKVGFDIGDGALKISAFTVQNDDGVSTNKTTIDLSSFKIDSEWKLDDRSSQPARPPTSGAARSFGALPSITVVFVGPLSQLGKLTPVVSVEGLVRELGVRRMERDVDELERLRRLDEERSKAEAERVKAATPGPPVIVIPPIPVPLAPPAGGATPGNTGSTTDASPDAAPATAGPTPAGEQKRRSSSGVISEQRQVPTSQSIKKSWMQDIFRNQGPASNGN
jgi:uncharacterized protein involved in outer membrane biogenesis